MLAHPPVEVRMRVPNLRRWTTVLALAFAIPARTAFAQQGTGTIRGRVVDAAANVPIADVQIFVEGSRLGAITAADGQYVIAGVPAGRVSVATRRISYEVARQTLDVPSGGTVTADFSLRATTATLEQVVVTGTGAPAERREIPNTVVTVAGDEVNGAPAAQSVDKALQGRVLGAVISQNNGQPGGGISIRLRGTGSISGGAEPLIVIDGVIVENNSDALVGLGANANRGGAALSNSLADIAPGDIERVEVVKGAAAAALYGSRANNGVIQIFTKRGTTGVPKVTYRVEGVTGATPKHYALNTSPVAGRGDVLYGGASAIGVPVTRYDYQDQLFQRMYGLTNQLSVTGGNNGTTYYVSGLWDTQTGIVRSTDLNNVNARASLTQVLSDKLSFTVGGNFIQRRTNYVPEGEQTQGVITTLIFTPTTFNPAYNPTLGRFPYSPVLGTNPLDVIANWEARDDVNRFIGNFNTTWTPISSLSVNYLFGFDRGNESFNYYQPPASTGAAFTGSVQTPARFVQRFNNDLTVTHKASPLTFLQTTTTFGLRQTSDHTDEVRAAALGLSPGQVTVGSGGATPSASEGIVDLRTIGGFLEERLGVRKSLFLTAGANYEASSAFGRDQRWQLFPRVGASWSVNQEPFFENSFLKSAFTTLRLRAAYGQSGGQPPSAYSIFSNYAVGSRAGKAALIPGSQSGNPDLKPERQREYEGGFDASFLGSRANLEFTVYDKRSTDLVLGVPLPLSSGFSTQLQNVGALSNKGIEVGLSGAVLDTRFVQWTSRLGYAANRSRVEKLVTATDTLLYGYLNYVIVGQPVGVFYGSYYPRDAQGKIVATGRLDASCNPIAGTAGIIVSRARGTNCTILKKILGNPEPKFTLSWNNDFNIGRHASVSFLLDGRFGNKVANFSRRISDYFGAGVNSSTEQCVTVGTTVYCQQTLNTERHVLYEEFVENGSFVKLREAAVRYTIDQPWVRRLGTQSVTVSLAGRNLNTWTKYTGIDPEVNLFSANTVARGVEFGTSPIPRTFALGVTANF
jgi:TonB-linked SusC/RagA family outer membrane protein